jgi:hypothetical protein
MSLCNTHEEIRRNVVPTIASGIAEQAVAEGSLVQLRGLLSRLEDAPDLEESATASAKSSVTGRGVEETRQERGAQVTRLRTQRIAQPESYPVSVCVFEAEILVPAVRAEGVCHSLGEPEIRQKMPEASKLALRRGQSARLRNSRESLRHVLETYQAPHLLDEIRFAL